MKKLAILMLIGVAGWGQQIDWIKQVKNKTVFDVREYGAKGDGTTDDTVAIQAALDACYAALSTSQGVGVDAKMVVFPQGAYVVTDTLSWKSCGIEGTQLDVGTRLIWDGTTGAGPLLWRRNGATYAGGGSYGTLKNIMLVSAADKAVSNLLSFEDYVDVGFRIENVGFRATTDACILARNGWINWHMNNVRFDSCGTYAIDARPYNGQNGSSFSLIGFTYDHRCGYNSYNYCGGSTGKGFIRFDNYYNQGNLGVAYISSGRIEVNTAYSSEKSLITFKEYSPIGSKFLQVTLNSIYYQDVIGMADDVAVYRDSADTSSTSSFTIQASRLEGISALTGGTWPAVTPTVYLPTDRIIGRIEFNTGATAAYNFPTKQYLVATSDSVLDVYVGTESYARLNILGTGKITLGDGSAAGSAVIKYGGTAALLVGTDGDSNGYLDINGGVSGGGTTRSATLDFLDRGVTKYRIERRSSDNALNIAQQGGSDRVTLTEGPGASNYYTVGTGSHYFNAGGVLQGRWNSAGLYFDAGRLYLPIVLFANLGTPTQSGAIVWCDDCSKATPCSGSGGGALAKYTSASAWDCN